MTESTVSQGRKTYHHLYDRHWRRARLRFLAEHPLCAECQKDGRIEAATIVDHIIPHRGDRQLFWDRANNWQALCKPHHNGHKQSLEKGGRGRLAIGHDGWPLR